MDADKGALLKLAKLAGVYTHYKDLWEREHTPPLSTIRTVLRAMGYEDTTSALRELKGRPWNRLMEPVIVATSVDQPPVIPIHFPLEEGREQEVVIRAEFIHEDGGSETHEGRGVTLAGEHELEGKRYVRAHIPNRTDRPIGYHELKLSVHCPGFDGEAGSRLIIAPPMCHMPAGKCWGITMSLYGLRTGQNSGAGDLGDLREFMRWAGGEHGAGFVGTNPLHSIPNSLLEGISPYSPISRQYRSLLYADLRDVPGLGEKDAKESQERSEAQRASPLVDYDAVAAIKSEMLRRAFDRWSQSPPGHEAKEYGVYLKREGHDLEDYATFMALSSHMRDKGYTGRDWQAWPNGYSSPTSPEVALFRKIHGPEVEFHKFVQWVLDRQLAGIAGASHDMAVGLYLDLAVGSSAHGSDAWARQDTYALSLDTGAPPDAFNPEGQNWMFPPIMPERLREDGYGHFASIMRSNMRHAGALRIDHALGLFRVFCIPAGRPASEGTYLAYPSEDLLRIIALESTRAETVVIAEDLGTVTREAREALPRYGMLSYRLLYFERNWESGDFLPPEMYPEQAQAAVNTHDLPTLRGFLKGTDIVHRGRLGITTEAQTEEALRVRQEEVRKLRQALGAKVNDNYREVFVAAHRFLVESPAALVSISLDDILGELEQQNVPGRAAGHPNWRRKSAETLENFKNRKTGLERLTIAFGKTGR